MNEQYDFAVYTDKELKLKGCATMEKAKEVAKQTALASRIGSRTEMYCFNTECRHWELAYEWLNTPRILGQFRPDHEEAVLCGRTMPIASL